MHDIDSHGQSPTVVDQRPTARYSNTSDSVVATLSWFLGLPILGGTAGFIGYIFAAFALANRNTSTESILSYGQQAFLFSLPMCTLISAAIGLGLAFSIIRKYATSILILLLVSLSGWAVNDSLWKDQIRTYGPDPSEVVLYYPPLACSGIAMLIAAVVAARALVTRRRKVM